MAFESPEEIADKTAGKLDEAISLHYPWGGSRKIAGVLGGVGPAATAHFLQRVVDFTDAHTDQDNVDLIVTQRSSTPDRTLSITDSSAPNPTASLLRDASILQKAGAEFLVMPCNTGMYHLNQVKGDLSLPLIDTVKVTVNHLLDRLGDGKKIAILGTVGTRTTGLYERATEDLDIEVGYPSEDLQEIVTNIIYEHVKANLPVPEDLWNNLLSGLDTAGFDGAITGCTELSIAQAALPNNVLPITDSVDALAIETVKAAGAKLKLTFAE